MSRRLFFYVAAGLIVIQFLLAGCNMPTAKKLLPSPTPAENPFPFPSTPTPTIARMPLVRVLAITASQYGRQLNLLVGDTFVLHRFKGDREPLNIDFPQVLEAEGDLKASAVVLKALSVGTARVGTLIHYPCPATATDCRPPDPFLYVQVVVSTPTFFIPYVGK